ncbi:MAG: AEC family transporter [Campylobacterota bacterium]|nr:AEC family transporter [Campylobacterota bacterium]
MSTLLAVVSIYIFIFLGYTAKKIFKDDIDEKTLILVSLYFLQPILTFWGLTRAPIDFNLIYTPFLYFIIVTISLVILFFVSKMIFDDEQDRSIFVASSLIGNTGNLGIPLGIALFGESSVPYTSIINIANIFFIYTVGIYFFAKSQYSFQDSLKQMIKIPILWFAIVALVYNYYDLPIHSQMEQILQMGAYATIVLQLMIFGVYLAKTPIKTQNYKLSLNISFSKLIFLPLIGVGVILFSDLPNDLASILMVSLFVPLAVNNVNIASLYKCKPYDVTAAVLVSTLLFLFIAYINLEFIKDIFGAF